MDEEQMEIKNDLNDQIQIKDEPIDQLFVQPLTENNNILNDKMHIKDEPINRGYLLSSKEHTNFTNSSICQNTKMKIPETCQKSKPFNEPEKSEMFISYEIYESNIPPKMSAMNCDPLHIPVHEEKMQKEGSYKLEIQETIQNSNVCGKEKSSPKSRLKSKIVFPCCICFKVLQTKNGLKRHTLRDHEGKKSNIIQPFEKTNFTNSHNQPIKEDIPEIFADPISKTFNEPEKLEEPGIFVKSETDIKPEIIFLPLKKFKQDSNQSNHHAKSKTIEKKSNLKMASVKDNVNSTSDLNKGFSTVFKCSVCLEVFVGRYDLKYHLVKFHGVKCKFCPEFVKSTDMDEHIALLHTIKCHFCPKHFEEGSEMNAHVTSVHAIECQFCAAKFLTLNDMSDHITAFHEACSSSTYLEPKSIKVKLRCSVCCKTDFYCLC